MQQFYYTYDKNGINLKQYIYTVGSYHLNWHRELELMTILNGEVEVCSEGVCRVLKEDDVIIFNSNKGHVTFAKKPDSIVMLLHIDPEFLRNYSKNGSYLNFDCCSNNKSRDEKPFRLIRSYLSEMILCSNKETIGQRLHFESTYYALLYTIVSYFQPKEIPATVYLHNEDRIDAISKMLRYIDKNYMQKITLNDLSQLSQYDRNYISQLFKAQLGINFHDYLTRIRLRNATLELKTDKNISDIALDNGFSDVKAFNRAFKSNFQKTPTEYRMQLNDNIIEIDTRFKKEFIPFDDKKLI